MTFNTLFNLGDVVYDHVRNLAFMVAEIKIEAYSNDLGEFIVTQYRSKTPATSRQVKRLGLKFFNRGPWCHEKDLVPGAFKVSLVKGAQPK